MKNIKVWDYLDEYRLYKKEILNSVHRVFSSGNLILAKEVKTFEKNFSKLISKKHAIGVNSGTDAIQIALMSLNFKKGSEVITTSNTAVPTVSAIVSAGYKPVFVDINDDDYLININKIYKAISKKTKAIIPVNLYGQSANLKEIMKIGKKYNLKVIEDCAQSFGSFHNKKPTGSYGDLSAFSFYPTKILGGYGDGGIITTSNKKLYAKCQSLRKYGMKNKYYSFEHGINSRLDEVQAGILNFKLTKINSFIKKRREIAEYYNYHLKNTPLILPKENKLNYHSYYVYVVRHNKRNIIINKLKNKNIYCNVSYPYPIHLMSGYKYLNYKRGDLPVTESCAKTIFSLPMYPFITLSKLKYTVNSIKKILNEI